MGCVRGGRENIGKGSREEMEGSREERSLMKWLEVGGGNWNRTLRG